MEWYLEFILLKKFWMSLFEYIVKFVYIFYH